MREHATARDGQELYGSGQDQAPWKYSHIRDSLITELHKHFQTPAGLGGQRIRNIECNQVS